MIIDDRLATVLATPASGPGSATQARQLIDLLDRSVDWHEAHDAALAQLQSRLEALPEPIQARIATEARLRSPRLVAALARARPRVAAAALGSARLSDAEWVDLIPGLSPLARGLLRHRPDMMRDRTSEAARLLARLGVTDAALPLPQGYEEAETPAIAPGPPLRLLPTVEEIGAEAPLELGEFAEPEGIGAIVQRIEAFRKTRTAEPDKAGFGRTGAGALAAPMLTSIDLAIDPAGTICAARGVTAAMLVGHRPFTADRRAPAHCDPATLLAARQRQPVRGGRISFEGAPAIAGPWRIDAVPCFDPVGRSFTGWQARLRRPKSAGVPANDRGVVGVAPAAAGGEPDDRLRQLLHELKTPINAIQGFAELIQQQVMSPVAHQYRGLAASIASDAATMLAQFEAIDQLIRLESGRQSIEPGETEARQALTALVDRLAPLFDARGASLSFQPGDESLPLGIAAEAFEAMAWRLLSTLAAAAVPGELLTLRLGREGPFMRLSARLPQGLVIDPQPAPASLLGREFALRLLGAEARAAGGSARRSERFLTLVIPLLTHSASNPSPKDVTPAALGQ